MEEEKVKKPKSKTVSTYKKLKAGKIALNVGTFLAPIVPATVVTIINWEEWFQKSSSSLPFGFASILITVVIAILGVLKSDTVFKKADIALYFLACLFACIGITCMFLASLFEQMGLMWVYTSAGLLGSGVCVTVNKKVIEPQIDFYKGLIADNCLDNKSKRKQERIERAQQEARREAEELEEKRRRATTE